VHTKLNWIAVVQIVVELNFILVREAQQIILLTLELRVSVVATSFIPRSWKINSQCYKNFKAKFVVELVPKEINKEGRPGYMRGGI